MLNYHFSQLEVWQHCSQLAFFNFCPSSALFVRAPDLLPQFPGYPEYTRITVMMHHGCNYLVAFRSNTGIPNCKPNNALCIYYIHKIYPSSSHHRHQQHQHHCHTTRIKRISTIIENMSRLLRPLTSLQHAVLIAAFLCE